MSSFVESDTRIRFNCTLLSHVEVLVTYTDTPPAFLTLAGDNTPMRPR